MTQYLPPNLLALFAPRDPVPYLPPLDKLPHEKKFAPYLGVSQCLAEFEDPKDTPPPTRVETKDERKERKRKERAEQVAYKLEQDLALWDPANDPNSTSDPFKTLFVARINYDTSESKLRREFEVYGPIRAIHLVTNRNNSKPRGYAFIEYEHERDMHSAYKHADGKKIDGRRVLVDVERSRTVKGWRPRRLGGGLGGTRKGGPDVNTKYSGRDEGGGLARDERRDRSRSIERERPVGRHRSRSRERVERRPRRSRSRERRRRSRSRDRKRSRDKEEEPVPEDTPGGGGGGGGGGRRRRRSRSRDRTRRSRSRDRKRRRSRSRDRSRRSRSRERRERRGEDGEYEVQVKQEQFDPGYDAYTNGNAANPGTDYPGYQEQPVPNPYGSTEMNNTDPYEAPPSPPDVKEGILNEYGTQS